MAKLMRLLLIRRLRNLLQDSGLPCFNGLLLTRHQLQIPQFWGAQETVTVPRLSIGPK